MKQPLFIASGLNYDVSFYEHEKGILFWLNSYPAVHKELISREKLHELSVLFKSAAKEKTRIVLSSGGVIKKWITVKPLKGDFCHIRLYIGLSFWLPLTGYFFKMSKAHLESIGAFMHNIAES